MVAFPTGMGRWEKGGDGPPAPGDEGVEHSRLEPPDETAWISTEAGALTGAGLDAGEETEPPVLDLAQADFFDYPELVLALESSEARENSPVKPDEGYGLHRQLPGEITARECLERFDPKRAGLPEVPRGEAERYLELHEASRPWLRPALGRDLDVQRVYAALDKGQGHALERHEGFGDDEIQRRRVCYLEDPAQLDPIKRAARIDGIRPGDRPHICGAYATRIHDPDAFAVALAHGIEHPRVRDVLGSKYVKGDPPSSVSVPLKDLLGPDGHHYCSGYKLSGDDLDQARKQRATWLNARDRSSTAAGPEPHAEAVNSFDGWLLQFHFRRNATLDGYEVSTMFLVPPEDALNEEKST